MGNRRWKERQLGNKCIHLLCFYIQQIRRTASMFTIHTFSFANVLQNKYNVYKTDLCLYSATWNDSFIHVYAAWGVAPHLHLGTHLNFMPPYSNCLYTVMCALSYLHLINIRWQYLACITVSLLVCFMHVHTECRYICTEPRVTDRGHVPRWFLRRWSVQHAKEIPFMADFWGCHCFMERERAQMRDRQKETERQTYRERQTERERD